MSGAGSRIDTRSVVFTDLVGSTEYRVRRGEDAAERLRRVHDALVGDASAAHGGTVVKGLGDGVMVTFGSAAEAVAAAVAIQQAVELETRDALDDACLVRVGVSVGDVTIEDDDVFGVPVVEASRLCSAATSGEILVADVVRSLSRGRVGFVFEPMGSLEFKGLPEAVPACRVVWERFDRGAETSDRRLPPALVGGATTGYVGRPELLQRLGERWQAAAEGGCHTVLLAGEPGVGKTRTAAELARVAHAQGALVLYGRCEEGLGVPYQPFVEALDWYTGGDSSAASLGRLPAELARLVPDLGERVAALPPPLASDPGSEEYRLMEAAASWLVQASESNGALVVLDDLHWAAKPTLLMLLHFLRAAGTADCRLLVVATYRDTDIDRRHPLADTLAELRRLAGVDRMAIHGLTAAEVLAFVETASGYPLDADARRLAAVVYEETEGNPFFVGEVLRHLVETGAVKREPDRWVVADLGHLSVPEGVRDVVGRRLTQLSSEANEVLAVAAVIGRSIHLDVLVAVSTADEDQVLDALDEAVRARLVDETGPGRFRFAHALVRSTLYEELSVTRRRRLHRRVAAALEQLHPDDVVALAHHCVAAGPDGRDVARAVGYVLGAGDHAQATRALADAEEQFRLALELLTDADLPMVALEIAARCGLGECRRDQGDPAYRDLLLEAARHAEAAGEVELLVRAVLANTRGVTSIVGAVDEERVELTEAALDALGPEPSPDRARLLAHLAAELAFAGQDTRCLRLADEAEALARQLGDRRLLGWVLVRTGFAAVVDDRWRALVGRSTEAVDLADGSGDPSLRVLARLWRAGAALTAGDVATFEADKEAMLEIAEEGSPVLRWMAAAQWLVIPLLRGDLDDVRRRNDECLALGEALGQGDAPAWWGAIATLEEWCRGDTAMVDAVGAFADEYPQLPAWRAAHAWRLAEAGRLDEARDVLARPDLDPATLGRDPFPFHSVVLVARAAAFVGDRDLVRRTMETLEAYRGCWSHYYGGTTGPVTWTLGIGALAVGDHDPAVADLDAALAEVTALGYEALVPRLRLHLAEALLARGGPGDEPRAARMLDDVRAGDARLRAPALAARADRLTARHLSPSSGAHQPPPPGSRS